MPKTSRTGKKAAKEEWTITSVLSEERKFHPDPKFSREAHVSSFLQYKKIYNLSVRDPHKFWAGIASELHWFKKWKRVLQWKAPFAKWFVGGRTNVSYNCLDRHLNTWRKNNDCGTQNGLIPAGVCTTTLP